MSYTVLARRYRPQQFSELVGQETVARALSNALNQQRLHHAYLFTGTRGVGKTTVARILAKSLNCEQGPSSTPCGNCSACLAIQNGTHPDLFEIDAASRTKVEDTRDLLENVQYKPVRGRYKVYLIDEVHMLSTHSFNALLKTLEEPPADIVFLLATTEPEKIPATIHSRCLHFTLRRVPKNKIMAHLEYVLTQEKIPAETEALELIADAAKGSLRDALSITDQAIAYAENDITLLAVQQLLGTLDPAEISVILKALLENAAKNIVDFCESQDTNGCDFGLLLDRLIETFHAIAVEQLTASNVYPTLRYFAQQFSREDIQLYYQIALYTKRDFELAPTPRLAFEMALLRMLAFTLPSTESNPKTNKSIPTLDTTGPTPGLASTKTSPTYNTQPAKHISTPADESEKLAQDPLLPNHDHNQREEEWATLLPSLNLQGPTLALAEHCVWKKRQENSIELSITKNHVPLLSPQNQERLKNALSHYFDTEIRLNIVIDQVTGITPAALNAVKKQKSQEAALETLELDPQLQQLLASFEAKIDPTTIKIAKK